MKRTPSSSGNAASALWIGVLTVTLVMAFAGMGLAQDQEEGESLGDLETQETASMREATYKELAKAQEAAEAENYSEARRILDKLSDEDLNDYEKAQLLNLSAYIYYAQDRYPQAIAAYDELLKQPGLPEALKTSTVYTLSQLTFSQEQWEKSINLLEWWMTLTSEESRTAYEMMAQAYYQMGRYDEALQPAYRAIELTKQSGEPVAENSYLLLRVLHYENGQYQQVAQVLHELINRWPKKQYWMQLASIYGEMENQRKQLNTLELAYLQGYLTSETEILSLVGLLLNEDLYMRAGKILEKGLEDGTVTSDLDHWRLLSQAWTMAQESDRAIPALARASELSSDGKMDLILAQTYMNLGRWTDAVASALRAMTKGGLARPDQAQVMLGQALFELARFDEARAAFEAAQSDRRSRQLAAQWIVYIENEKDRRAQLAAALE
jgi:tetratricopeptide (TPR) repeat protein